MVYYKFIDDSSDSRKIQHESGINLLQEVMLEKFGCDISEDDIVKEKNSKPRFRGIDGICFNISHCGGLCCCIVSSRECGIDCEKIRDYRPNVIKRIFTDDESAWFDSLDTQMKNRFFFILWTLKESYGKYTGKGIADMKNVSFSIQNDVLSSDKSDLDFFVYELEGYILSICVKKGDIPECNFGKRIY